jgi:hypothetical protein
LLVCFLVCVWLAFGMRAPLSPWKLLHKLPVFNIMRVAERFRLAFLLCGAVFAGLGLQTLQTAAGRRTASLIGPVLAALVLGDLVWVNGRIWRDAFPIPPQVSQRASGNEFSQVWASAPYDRHGSLVERLQSAGQAAIPDYGLLYAANSSHYPAFLRNQGIVYGYEDEAVPKRALPVTSPQYRGEVWLEDARGEAELVRWTPNRLTVRVRAERDGYLLVNQNYYPGWRAQGDPARPVLPYDDLLAVAVGPADREIELYYRPASFMVGAWVSGLTLAGCLVALWCRRRSAPHRPGEGERHVPGR